MPFKEGLEDENQSSQTFHLNCWSLDHLRPNHCGIRNIGYSCNQDVVRRLASGQKSPKLVYPRHFHDDKLCFVVLRFHIMEVLEIYWTNRWTNLDRLRMCWRNLVLGGLRSGKRCHPHSGVLVPRFLHSPMKSQTDEHFRLLVHHLDTDPINHKEGNEI